MTGESEPLAYPPVPRIAERFLESLGADAEFRELVLGDLAEEFAIRAQWDGVRIARRWYYSESLRVAPHLIRHGLKDLGPAGVVRVVAPVVAGIVAVVMTETVMIRVFHVRQLLEHCYAARCVLIKPRLWVSAMLAWTVLDGLVGGYVAGRVGSRRPLLSAAATASAIVLAMVFPGRLVAPRMFLALSIIAVVASVMAGGVAATFGRRRSREAVA